MQLAQANDNAVGLCSLHDLFADVVCKTGDPVRGENDGALKNQRHNCLTVEHFELVSFS